MEPTLIVDQRVAVDPHAYRLAPPQRGDLILLKFPHDPSKEFIKRVIAVAGDTIGLQGGRVFINGQPVDEPYRKTECPSLSPPVAQETELGALEVPTQHVFVLGDNRLSSFDPRHWGPLPETLIVGQVRLAP